MDLGDQLQRALRVLIIDQSSARTRHRAYMRVRVIGIILRRWHFIEQDAYSTPCAPCSDRFGVVDGRLQWKRRHADVALA